MNAFIYGAGAQGRVVAEALKAGGRHRNIAFLDDDEALWGQCVDGFPITGPGKVSGAQGGVIVALGHPMMRLELLRRLRGGGWRLINAVHPTAAMASTTALGEGIYVGPGAVLQTGVKLGDGVIVNTGAVVEHDSRVGAGAAVSAQAVVGGRCELGERCFISMGAVLLPRLEIGEEAVVAAGAVVTRNVPARSLALGVPARVSPLGPDFGWANVL